MLEYVQTIPTFWDTMTKFIKKNPQYLAKDNAMDFFSNDEGKSYNLCHCKFKCLSLAPVAPPFFALPLNASEPRAVWSNFEIADMDFWRGEAYMKYFEYLESQGGFYYEVSVSRLRLYLVSQVPFHFLPPV